tara:strand:+ start:148 stop:753 length:606 start_codon:yes stop_codon:yes gene_type:complete
MNFLSIDCSTNIGSLFISYKNKTFIKYLHNDKSNNDLLMMQILNFLSENKLKFNDISKIFVNQGPGNFSGLRTSLAVAKGISLSTNLSLVGYNTFIWACAKFFGKNKLIYSLIEFRGKFFIKKFDKNLSSHTNATQISIDKIIEKYDSKFKVIPKNTIKNFDKKIFKRNNLSIIDLKHIELEFLEQKGLLNKKLIKPLYLS